MFWCVLRSRCTGGVEVDVHDILSATNNFVPPLIAPQLWIVMANPASSDALMAFQWKGKRLAMTFEGGLSTASYRRACNRREAPEGYDLFYYKDEGTKQVALASQRICFDLASPRLGDYYDY